MGLIFEWPHWYERQGFLKNVTDNTYETQYQQAFDRILNKIIKDVIEG
jgi:hypothetical protein